jgi:four helix bundle protein
MTFRSYKDINAWKKACKVTRSIYEITSEGPLKRDFGLRDQMRRSAVSVMSNIAEGFGRGGNKEFVLYLGYARGSLRELQSQLHVALDVGYISQSTFNEIYEETSAMSGLVNGLINHLKASSIRGSRYA